MTTKKLTKTTEQIDQEYKREAIACVVAALIGWAWLSIVLEPVALWRSIHVLRHSDVQSTKTIATVACVISSIAVAILVFSFVIIAMVASRG